MGLVVVWVQDNGGQALRNAEDIVREYFERGYSADRIRILASTKPEAVRERILQLLEEQAEIGEDPIAADDLKDDAALADTDPADETDVFPVAAAEQEALDEEIGRLEDAPPKKRQATAKRERKKKTVRARKTKSKTSAKTRKTKAKAEEHVTVSDADGRKTDRLEKHVATIEEELEHANASVAELQARVEKLAALEGDLDAMFEQRAAMVERAEGLERKVEELSGAHASREKTQKALVATRKELARAKKRLGKSQDKLNEMASELKEAEARAGEHAQLLAASDVSGMEEEADGLREQLEDNERRLAELRDSLVSREDELHGLRSKFEKEADTLRSRAEQEVRLMRRHVLFYGRLARTAGVAAGVLFCFLVAAFAFDWFVDADGPDIARHTVEIGGGDRAGAEEVLGSDFLAGLEEVDPAVAPPAAAADERSVAIGELELPPPVSMKAPELDAPASRAPESGSSIQPPTTAVLVAPKPQPEYIDYRVRKGDKLWSICNKQLHNTRFSCLQRVAEINKLRDPSVLRPGQILKLPVSEKRN